MTPRPVPDGVEALPDATARVLAALWAVWADDGRATVRAVAARADRSLSTTYYHLRFLAALGLVAGLGDRRQATLRPVVWPVEVSARRPAAA